MTAVRSETHLMELAAQRLPVPSKEVVRLIEENRRMREALTFISKTDDFDAR